MNMERTPDSTKKRDVSIEDDCLRTIIQRNETLIQEKDEVEG